MDDASFEKIPNTKILKTVSFTIEETSPLEHTQREIELVRIVSDRLIASKRSETCWDLLPSETVDSIGSLGAGLLGIISFGLRLFNRLQAFSARHEWSKADVNAICIQILRYTGLAKWLSFGFAEYRPIGRRPLRYHQTYSLYYDSLVSKEDGNITTVCHRIDQLLSKPWTGTLDFTRPGLLSRGFSVGTQYGVSEDEVHVDDFKIQDDLTCVLDEIGQVEHRLLQLQRHLFVTREMPRASVYMDRFLTQIADQVMNYNPNEGPLEPLSHDLDGSHRLSYSFRANNTSLQTIDTAFTKYSDLGVCQADQSSMYRVEVDFSATHFSSNVQLALPDSDAASQYSNRRVILDYDQYARGPRSSLDLRTGDKIIPKFGSSIQQHNIPRNLQQSVLANGGPSIQRREAAQAAQADAGTVRRVVDIGALLVRFPEWSRWKHGVLQLDDEGFVLFSPSPSEAHSTARQQFHLNDVQIPASPYYADGPYPYSISMGLKDGTSRRAVHLGCRSSAEQKRVLKCMSLS